VFANQHFKASDFFSVRQCAPTPFGAIEYNRILHFWLTQTYKIKTRLFDEKTKKDGEKTKSKHIPQLFFFPFLSIPSRHLCKG